MYIKAWFIFQAKPILDILTTSFIKWVCHFNDFRTNNIMSVYNRYA